ncbi:MAG TPA: hypothetical protein PLJ35_07715, partial [Anaerolineae bacterium]|nr:hypothetical protein [Anaerolineae bacterium]
MGTRRAFSERLLKPEAALKLLQHAILIVGSLLMVLPFVWMLSTSLKPPSEVLSWPPQLVPRHVAIENYVAVFQTAPFHLF